MNKYEQDHNNEAFDDDQPVGRILSRREVIGLLGGTGIALLACAGFRQIDFSQAVDTATPTPSATGTAIPSCVVRPKLTEGPYFVDEMLNRSDIRIDPADGSVKDGALLRLILNVSDVSANTCSPLVGAQVDVWHCDALGVYCDVTDRSFDTTGQKWLRGYQVTDEYGVVQFTTIYPGWYSGRAVHIHFKIRTDPASDAGYEFTSQFFFDDALTDKVHAQAPYAAKGQRNMRNEQDGIYQQSEGMTVLDVTQDEDGAYTATFGIGVDLSQPTASADRRTRERRGFPRTDAAAAARQSSNSLRCRGMTQPCPYEA